ncbi:hypothetical protein [Zhihengliuella sp.]|uniref:hypothetical protein n=1 Tax=Zhihengliuella sp. TaxID=1954483 RepID=UPI002810AAA1|nr:hypothetical protein [Zhihengliuella sp.]
MGRRSAPRERRRRGAPLAGMLLLLVVGAAVVAVIGVALTMGIVHFVQEARGGPAPETPRLSKIEGSAGTDSSEAAAASPSADAPSSEELQAWSDQKMEQWLAAEGAGSVDDFSCPFDLIRSWESPDPGLLVLHVEAEVDGDAPTICPGQDGAVDLEEIATVAMEGIAPDAPHLDMVVAMTLDGQSLATSTRQDLESAD